MSGKQITRLTQSERRRRRFSESFKKQKVKEFELGKVRICEIRKVYQVSNMTVHRWINKFGTIN